MTHNLFKVSVVSKLGLYERKQAKKDSISDNKTLILLPLQLNYKYLLIA